MAMGWKSKTLPRLPIREIGNLGKPQLEAFAALVINGVEVSYRTQCKIIIDGGAVFLDRDLTFDFDLTGTIEEVVFFQKARGGRYLVKLVLSLSQRTIKAGKLPD